MKIQVRNKNPLPLTPSCSVLLMLFTAAQATAQTSLQIEKTNNQVVLTWPATADPNFRVDGSAYPGSSFTPRFEPVVQVGPSRQITISQDVPARFFRLFDPVTAASIGRGGTLYDAYWLTTGAPTPTTNHPLWALRPDQISSTSVGGTTWRCKECHGWDYRGVDGAYATGSRRTGFQGIFGTTKTEPELTDLIKNHHSYGPVLSDVEITNLVRFVLYGQTDTRAFVATNRTFTGDAVRGKELYLTGVGETPGCAKCHSTDGLGKPPDFPTYIDYAGLIAGTNPWEFQHKIRFGGRGKSPTPMAGIIEHGGTLQDMVDVGAYAQTLPRTITATVARGGALYDKWWAVTGPVGGAGPTNNHPLWASRPDQISNKTVGEGTWRCKECHGWDYRGVNGAYATGSRRTGIAGITGTTKTEAELTDLLTNDHGYASVLGAVEIQSLVLFVLQGQIDTTTILTNRVFIGDAVHGQVLYDSGLGAKLSCTICHGANGLMTPPGYTNFINYVGFIATTNPWEFQHKMRFGHPGTSMEGALEAGLQDIADVSAYSQSLPVAPPPPSP